MSDEFQEALAAAIQVMGSGDQSYLKLLKLADRSVEIEVKHLAVLADYVQRGIALEPHRKAQAQELQRLREKVLSTLPKRNTEDIYFEDYLCAVAGDFYDTKMTRQEALTFVAKRYKKTESAMFAALKRELKYRRDTGESQFRIGLSEYTEKPLPRNPETKN